jgi:hypothetical protein
MDRLREIDFNKLNEAKKTLKKRMFTYIAAGLGLVAGLAWNDAIRSTIDYLVPDTGNTVLAKILYATILTIVVGLILLYVEKSLQENKIEDKQGQNK